MCGIAGQISLSNNSLYLLENKLNIMANSIQHRGPDDSGKWINNKNSLGLVHKRLSIIDLSKSSSQPMKDNNDNLVIIFNGEIYNFVELRNDLKDFYKFKTTSDTETILAAYTKYKVDCLRHFRGMYSFAIWDEKNQSLFCARDRFGIKPFYYTIQDDVFYFASETKALLPFIKDLKIDEEALTEYLTFQYNIGEKTLFQGINQLLPGHIIKLKDGEIKISKYWDVNYKINFEKDEDYFYEGIRVLMEESISLHCRSDVQIGSYLSGGIDSSLIYKMSLEKSKVSGFAFHGRYIDYEGFDESEYAKAAINTQDDLKIIDINSNDFINVIENVIYHLDYPTAGPGSFSQYMVSKLASKYVKVVLGGQGGDEIFGGYARYLIAYFEQCITAAIDGNYKNGNYVVTIESIIPQLVTLKEYKPMIKKFWSEGLFESMDVRYFYLINRSLEFKDEVFLNELNVEKVYSKFLKIFQNNNVGEDAYFDKMTHFDFKCMLPSLLQVEDRMSMAHGIESRVPILDHPLVEFAATIPADIKFKNGKMKDILKNVFKKEIPKRISKRRDKMGFPVPLNNWFKKELKEFALDHFRKMSRNGRPFINSKALNNTFEEEAKFSRKTWALLSLELWYQCFFDNHKYWEEVI